MQQLHKSDLWLVEPEFKAIIENDFSDIGSINSADWALKPWKLLFRPQNHLSITILK